MQQIWAEVYELWKNGSTHYLTHQEMLDLNKHNESYQVKDAFEEMFYEFFTLSDEKTDFMSSLEILKVFGINVPTARDFSRLRHVLKKLGVTPARTTSTKGYLVKMVNGDTEATQNF
jgi:predicted P-loop ATPase